MALRSSETVQRENREPDLLGLAALIAVGLTLGFFVAAFLPWLDRVVGS